MSTYSLSFYLSVGGSVTKGRGTAGCCCDSTQVSKFVHESKCQMFNKNEYAMCDDTASCKWGKESID